MPRLSVTFFFVVACTFLFFASPTFAVKSLVRIRNLTKDAICDLANRGFDIPKIGSDYVEVVLDTRELKELFRSKLSHTVLVPDLDEYVANVINAQTRGVQYYTYQTMTDALKEYAAKYSNICKLESVGKSWEKRDIWAIKISDNPAKDEKEPSALVMGAHHAREWISVEVPMATIKTLIDGYGKDEYITRLVNDREIWVIPMVNPDGVTYSQTKEKFWRKNRRKNSDGTFGVDPNRNYGYQWGSVGSSDYPDDDTYHGTGPFSEPETQAIRDFARREHFSADITFHSYSELVLYPWSYSGPENAPDTELLAKFAEEMSKFNNYTAEKSSDLYPSMGDTDDFMYGELKSLSFTFELARTFIPAPTEIAGINAANVPAVLYMIDKAGTYGLVTPAGGENIPVLDNFTAVNALKDLAPFAANNDVLAHRYQQLEQELARRVAAEKQAGSSDILTLISAEMGETPEVSRIQKMARQCGAFEALHNPR